MPTGSNPKVTGAPEQEGDSDTSPAASHGNWGSFLHLVEIAKGRREACTSQGLNAYRS